MGRPHSKSVRLYRPKLSQQWWVRYTLPPEVARNFKPPAGSNNLKPDKDGRVSYSLQTPVKKRAEELAREIQQQLELAWKGTLNYKSFAVLTGSNSKVVRTLAEFFAELDKREQARVKIWFLHPSPIDRKNRGALDAIVAKRYRLHRDHLAEALAALYPGQSFMVHQFGIDTDSRPHLLKIREWFLQTRLLEAETYASFRGYFSGAWENIALLNGYADSNPWHHKSMEPPSQVAKDRRTCTLEERMKIFSLASTWQNNALKLMLLCGLRPVELCWWGFNSLNLETGMWQIMQSKVARRKEIPNTVDVAAIVEAQRAVLAKMGLQDSLWLFPRYYVGGRWGTGKGGEQCHRLLMAKQMNRALRTAIGDTDALGRPTEPYMLRRTFATIAGRRVKADPHNIAALMGHSDISQQMVYSQLDHEALKESAAAIQKQIKGG